MRAITLRVCTMQTNIVTKHNTHLLHAHLLTQTVVMPKQNKSLEKSLNHISHLPHKTLKLFTIDNPF